MEIWDEICAAWDDELMTTEEVKRLADMLFPPELVAAVQAEIDLLDCFEDIDLIAA